MADGQFKNRMTERFNKSVDYLLREGFAKNNTAISKFIGQPLQVVSKLLSGERIITLEQTSLFAKNTNINVHWLLTGEGEMLTSEASNIKKTERAPPEEVENLKNMLKEKEQTISELRQELNEAQKEIIKLLKTDATKQDKTQEKKRTA